ncbi:ribonuclease Z [Sporolactobacillus sp. THM7-7]|nr:ribonuclease Z [Sporolactobacillus sp. THM7-7]
MNFTFLGTGAGLPAKERNVTSIAVRFPEYDGNLWLFDCGEGTQRQILYTPVKLTKLKVIFITHLHGDHLFGLPGVLGSRSFQGSESPLLVIGPRGLKQYVWTALRASGTHIRYPLKVREISESGTVFEDEHFIVSAEALEHGISCFGYRIVEKDLPGELLVEKLKKAGIPPGPVYQKFKEQSEVLLSDGRCFKSAPFVGERKKGRRVAIIGDTRPCEQSIKLAKHTDLLIHEATFRDQDKAMAWNYRHSTSVQAAEIAREASAGALILTHLSSRYQKEEQAALLNEAKKVFGSTLLARDLWGYELKRQPRR